MPTRAKKLAPSHELSGFPDFLVERGIASPGQVRHLRALASSWGSDLLSACLGSDLASEDEITSLLCEYFGCPRADLKEALSASLLSEEDRELYFELKCFPWKQETGATLIVCASPSEAIRAWAAERFGNRFKFTLASSSDINAFLKERFGNVLIHDAVEKLNVKSAVDSSKVPLTENQRLLFISIGLLLAASFLFFTKPTLAVIFLLCNIYYVFTLGFRILLTLLGHFRIPETEVSEEDLAQVTDEELPTYTILVAMYKEDAIIPYLFQYLRELNYPRSKLEIKILLEKDDTKTLEVAQKLRAENFFDFIVIPPSQPKTKPKALNYALPFVHGEFLTIYDAEDRPDPDQLRKAYVIFKRLGNIACVQARLNYFNRAENLLTRLFTIEYSQWFDYFLLGLYRLKIPIPLGGTSNHFRTQILRDLCGWDPFNVTEDADLGVRLEKNGHRVAIVNSTTYEEANTHVGNWIRQRSRWLKGHMMTFLVHMRNPIRLLCHIGPVGFFGFIFFIGGPCFVALFNPILWTFVIALFLLKPYIHEALLPDYISSLASFNLVWGNALFILLGAFSVIKRKYWNLILACVLLPFYWLLQSVAAYKALWQLFYKPHFWEKTTHGLSNQLKRKPKDSE